MIKKTPVVLLGGVLFILLAFSVQRSHSSSNKFGGDNNEYLPFVTGKGEGGSGLPFPVNQDAS